MAPILVITDDTQLRSDLRVMLEEAGHQVLEAADGAQGIKTYRGQPVPLVFCDLFMPGKESWETIQELRRLGHDVKVIAMNGGNYNGAVDYLVAKKLGAAKMLRKPFELGALFELLDKVLPGQSELGLLTSGHERFFLGGHDAVCPS